MHQIQRFLALPLLLLFVARIQAQNLPVPEACGPYDVLPDEATPVYVYGSNFTPTTIIRIEGVGDLQAPVFVSPALIVGYTPPLDPDNPNQPPGWKDVSAHEEGGPTSVLVSGVLYVGYDVPYLKHCWPSEIGPAGGTLIHFYGRRFREGLLPSFEGVPCTGVQIVGESELTAIAPALPPRERYSFYQAEIADGVGETVVSRRQGALAVYEDSAPPVITSVEPFEVDARGGTSISIGGENLRNDGNAQIFVTGPTGGFLGGLEDRTLGDTFETVPSIEGTTPRIDPLDPATPPGAYSLVYQDLRGESTLPGSLLYVDHIRAVVPGVVSSAGGDVVAFEGYGLAGDWQPRIGRVACTEVVHESEQRILARVPRLPPGAYDADMLSGDGAVIEAYLPAGVVVEQSAVEIFTVAPSSASAGSSVEVTLTGLGFNEGLTPRMGGIPVVGAVPVSSGTFAGFLPALDPGVHDVDLVDAEGNVLASLPQAIEVTPAGPLDLLPAPQEIDAAYAEGEARFTWTNPLDYDTITVREILESGAIGRQLELAGNATSLRLSALRTGITLEMVGQAGDSLSRTAIVRAFPRACSLPAPLGGYGIVGNQGYPLYGGNLPRLPQRCSGAPGGGGGGINAIDLDVEWASINGFSSVGPGYAITSLDKNNRITPVPGFHVHSYANRLVTGFTLLEDAERLQIDGYYERLGEAQGLALMGRLVHVFPEDGFEDEFTFPDAAPGDPAGWHGLTYFRGDGDPGDPASRPCGLRIPRGDYILQIYAINGDVDRSYYSFRDDNRDVELLIPGAPCPPYPLVRVIDVTGRRTLPDLLEVKAAEVAPLRVEFTAVGHWFDEAGTRHSLDPADPSFVPHDFELTWRIASSEPDVAISSGTSNRVVTPVKAIGCYRVHLTIRDGACDRSVTRTKEAIVSPRSFACGVAPYTVHSPIPDPAAITAIAGLSPAPGAGRMAKGRELRLRVLISSESLCGGDSRVVSPELGDLEFQLAWSYLNTTVFPPRPETQVAIPTEGLTVTNLCASVVGAKYTYFEILTSGLGKARMLPGWADNGTKQNVFLQWRTLAKRVQTGPATFRREVVNDPFWHSVTPGFRMTNRPRSLESTSWQGTFTPETQTYRFLHQTAESAQDLVELGQSKSIPIGLVSGVNLPSFANNFRGGMSSAIEFVGGEFRAARAQVEEGGELLDNKIQGASLLVQGAKADPLDKTTFTWCHQQEIFNKTSEQALFNAVIFAAVIPPGIPLTVSASVGLALKVALTAQAGTVISPFAKLEGGNFMTSDLYFKSELGLHLPAAIRADALFGVVSAAIKLTPSVTSDFRFHLGNRDLDFIQEAYFKVFLKLTLQIKICVLGFLNSILGEANCIPIPDVDVIKPTTLVESGTFFEYEDCPDAAGGGGLAAVPPGQRGGGGGGDIEIDLEELFPATSASRDGTVRCDVGYQKADIVFPTRTDIYIQDGDAPRQLVGTRPAWELEPSIGFLSNTRVLVAWTRSFPQDAIDAGAVLRGDLNYTPEEQNFFRAHDEIIVTPIGETQPGRWNVLEDLLVSDVRSEVPDPANRRVDGRASLAGDEVHGDALIAWVRVDDPEYYYFDPATQGYRIHLEKTAIYARRVGFSGVLGPPRKLSGGGINIAPSVAFSPSGDRAYCVWVNDPIHVDLLASNRGRNLQYSVYDRASDSWSTPEAIFADPDSLPGMLDPTISLLGDDYGLLAFTALDASAEESDTGLLGMNRFVTISRLVGGTFGPPRRVHGKCEKRVFGSKVIIEVPRLSQDPLERVLKKPEWYMMWQATDVPGSPASAGGVLGSTLEIGSDLPSPAAPILLDGNVRSNIAVAATASGIQVLSLNLGEAFRQVSTSAGQGGGLADPAPAFFDTTAVSTLPDLAVASCKLSNQFPVAGEIVTAVVRIENDGFSASTSGEAGDDPVRLLASYIDAAGVARIVAEERLPAVGAGGNVEVTLQLEQPLDPVRLRVELTGNSFDLNRQNDVLTCHFGTPEPTGLTCEPTLLPATPGEEGVAGARLGAWLRWTNTIPYDEICLYRDGAMFASVPGASTSFLDTSVGPGLHTYEVRARVEASRSCRVPVTCSLDAATFRRGDADSNGAIEITDAVKVLGYLFLGTAAPECPDAADTDDNGHHDITDAIYILSYLFLGGPAPPAPGPEACGVDSGSDELEPCNSGCESS